MNEQRTYHSRSTRDGLGFVPDGTFPCTAEGAPDFAAFRGLDHALDFVTFQSAPTAEDLVASVASLQPLQVVYAMRPMLAKATDLAGTDEALPYWLALHTLVARLEGTDIVGDPFARADFRSLRKSLAAVGVPALRLAGLVEAAPGHAADECGCSVDPAASLDERFDSLIAASFYNGAGPA